MMLITINKTNNKKEVGLDAVILDVETKKSILRTINFIKKKEKYEAIGAVLPKGILLYGEPGTGKTLIGQTIAKETNYNFKLISASSLLGQYVGSSAKNIRDCFDELRKKGNSILFLDELDAIGMKRNSDENSKEYRSCLNELLAQISNEANSNIIVMATTNRPEDLDEALLRPGRFDLKIEIKKPDKEQRVKIFELYFNKVKHSEDLDLELLAEETDGETGAFIFTLINGSAIRAVDEDFEEVHMEHILDELKTMTNNDLEIKERNEIKPLNKIGFSID